MGSFEANAWGVYDMHGNVYEWVQDCWNSDYEGAPSDGYAWKSEDCSDRGDRVVRGGSWDYGRWWLRSAHRGEGPTEYRSNVNGFRVARDL